MASRVWLLAVAALVAVSAAAAAERPVPKRYYLALGDSIPYGVQPDKVERGLPPSGFDTGYVDVFAERLRALNPRTKVVNYSCPGETTQTFMHGRCPWLAEGRELHDAFRGTQLQAALAFLKAHPGQVSPITLTLWGNDVFAAFDGCRATVQCIRSRATSVAAGIGARLTSILRRLRAAAPGAVIVVTGAWNFDVDRLTETNVLYRALNPAIRRATAAAKARFADLIPVFNPAGSVAAQKARLCAYSFICSKDDVHPTDAGHRAIAMAVLGASGFVQP